MTEAELRRGVVDIINSWIGAAKGSEKHREILNIYNTHKPLARGYKVQTGDAYCATTVSAAWIKAGIAEYTGTECSCNELIRIAKSKGIWVENDAYVPKIGDAVLYDWQDTGVGDNVGQADHIGIVAGVSGSGFTVTEGNMSGGKVGQRSMAVNGRNIRGFICPDYKAIAEILTVEEDENMDVKKFRELYLEMRKESQDNDAESYSQEARDWAIANGLVKGSGTGPDGQPNYMWEDGLTREQFVTVLWRFVNWLKAELR